MEIREAILAAADHIEANPGEFNFGAIGYPSEPNCGTPGCALGWIGTFAGYNRGRTNGFSLAAVDLLGIKTTDELYYLGIAHDAASTFYKQMDAVVRDWRDSAQNCAKGLRLYADKYFPADATENTEEFPSIRAELDRIFAIEKAGTGVSA